ncbi:MAG: ABC transporter permease [Anaerolineae bacterium]
MQKPIYAAVWQSVWPTILALAVALIIGIFFVLPADENIFRVYWEWFTAGFGCQSAKNCALLTMLQYATPIILSGLSATVAFRAGLISIGQLGQMVVGAGFTTFVATNILIDPLPRTVLAVSAGMAGGALWGFLPGLLKAYLDIHEVISTLILNPLSLAAVGWMGWRRIPEEMQWEPFVAGTKLSWAFPLTLFTAVAIYFYLFRSTRGFRLRSSGQAMQHAGYAGISAKGSIVRGMMLSGALAGLAGSFEVLAVHYRFISSFSSLSQFDGIIVSLLGRLHPAGIVINAGIIGGLRLGALNGLQLQTDVPRELGNAIIAISMLLISIPPQYWRKITPKFRKNYD